LIVDSYSSYKLRIGILFYSRGTVVGQRFGRLLPLLSLLVVVVVVVVVVG
jgi:hypothetical protein